jgi:hypothetical protein
MGKKLHRVGFEPTHLSIMVLKTTALDHSAIDAYDVFTELTIYIGKLYILLDFTVRDESDGDGMLYGPYYWTDLVINTNDLSRFTTSVPK